MMMFEETDSFKGLFKKILKKYNTLDSDFERFKIALNTDGKELSGLVRLQLGNKITTPVYKASKFRCKYLKNKGVRSGIRVIFCWEQKNNPIKITFIEIYHKGKQENHDINKIIEFFNNRVDAQKNI